MQSDAGFCRTQVGADYTPEQVEFFMAIDAWKRRTGRVAPTWPEVLAIAQDLGWRKVAEPGPLPAPPGSRR